LTAEAAEGAEGRGTGVRKEREKDRFFAISDRIRFI